ncbi:hypothetical protein VB716_10390 [Synechococcus sp. CCY9201]|uniref:hypothetical protein n=1 Tax=Synechococcus sp. CCY9201 TaxID=174697 RepID=UPI002B20ED3B|nr:hypothetical protein [Synechococcus sp. CCY9201]MEA5474627.1 hypothetical protein [Synechococcus sp. CCY9201]
MDAQPFLHVRSAGLRILPGEDQELVNEGTYGKACALYLQAQLTAQGYAVPFFTCEDWGWWVEIQGLGRVCGIGIYGRALDDSDDLDLCVTVHLPSTSRWPWFGTQAQDSSPEIARLQELVRMIIEDDPESHDSW